MTYSTTDLNLAAFLRLSGCSLEQISTEGTKGTFIFDNIDHQLIEQYTFGNALVEPVAFNNMVKQLSTSVRQLTGRA